MRYQKNYLQLLYNRTITSNVKTTRKIKTIKAEFILTRTLSQLSLVQLRPYAALFPGFLFSLNVHVKK